MKESQSVSPFLPPVAGAEPQGRARRSPGERRIVGVQFRRAAGMVYDFDAADLDLPHDSRVVVESERGELLGWTVGIPEDRDPVVIDGRLRRVLRLVEHPDLGQEEKLRQREREVLRFAAGQVRAHGLEMKMVAAEWAHSGEKVVVYFSSEERVDFRSLVRDLAQRFRVRVEMRQVGPRDEVKILGAIGPCGRETCCTSWLRTFSPVSIRMAKDQGLSINPQKVTGVCGRLLCCLAFEQDTYRDLRRKLPKLGKIVVTPRGPAKVVDVLVLRGLVRVMLEGGEHVELAPDQLGEGAAAKTPAPAPVAVIEQPVETPPPAAPRREGRADRPGGKADRPERKGARPEKTPRADSKLRSEAKPRAETPPRPRTPANEAGVPSAPEARPAERSGRRRRSSGRPPAGAAAPEKTRGAAPAQVRAKSPHPSAPAAAGAPAAEGEAPRRTRQRHKSRRRGKGGPPSDGGPAGS